ncbi:hypothetical protein BD311DRAFT_764040 [Dichomitus squalens]|uniref:Uncharacterized protein n=1 Tax=Dichomitus squalens TaxID=114155 RepID=A0A4Q9MIH0_9APHY|nr:hypothetical protein BD311DRAFT_764040 [Dichomitus squalens]
MVRSWQCLGERPVPSPVQFSRPLRVLLLVVCRAIFTACGSGVFSIFLAAIWIWHICAIRGSLSSICSV